MYAGILPALIVTDHKMLQQIFITKFKYFSDRLVSHFNKLIICNKHIIYILFSQFAVPFFIDCCVKDLLLLNTKMTGLPLGLFECRSQRWKHIRQVTSPAFTNIKLQRVSHIFCTLYVCISICIYTILMQDINGARLNECCTACLKTYLHCTTDLDLTDSIAAALTGNPN